MQARGTAGVSCRRHLNGMLSSLIHTVGIDRNYVRGEGPYLWDDRGNRILDCLAGFGAIAVGRAHPVV
ncbi:MAG: aminotransferase class III-fold pyridoxal phosphate-dependent enzyme, partial [Gammaproteobacteria bacterium]|nr:aminotransferase class III-fold pyridoxal phosphate-dependent enzyme [Gammaproteobacteria bacterium]